VFEDHSGEGRTEAGAGRAHKIAAARTQEAARARGPVVQERVRAEGVAGDRDVVEQHPLDRKADPPAQSAPDHRVDVVRQDQVDFVELQPSPVGRGEHGIGERRLVLALETRRVG